MSVKIGIVGTGTVGGGCIDIVRAHHDRLFERYGLDLELVRVCSLVPEQAEAHGVADIFTLDYRDIVNDPRIQLVVEVIGGTGVAKSIVCEAIAAGKHVVTANKALIASCGDEILALAREHGVAVAYEASVGGGIPILGPLEHSLAANELVEVMGIVNGTTNFMLTRMEQDGKTYAEALAEAQSLGYAEADPTADVDGLDAAAKIAILASLAFGAWVGIGDVHAEGIRHLDVADLAAARDMGRRIKLLAAARNTPAGIEVGVHPTMVPLEHPLAAVNGVMNAIYVVGDFVGETMYYGAGAGSGPAASAVMGDVVELARHIEKGTAPVGNDAALPRPAFVPAEDLLSRFYVRVPLTGGQSALERTEAAFAEAGVQVESAFLAGGCDGEGQPALICGPCSNADVRRALEMAAGPNCPLDGEPAIIRIL